MIWPWSTIRMLRKRIDQLERDLETKCKWYFIQQANAAKWMNELAGAHKGIRRLKEKLKKASHDKT